MDGNCEICGQPSGNRQMSAKCESMVNIDMVLAEQLKKVV